LIGCPISRSLTTYCVCLELFPPTALPGFSGTAYLSATSGRPACPSRASGWSSRTTPRGRPVLRTLSLCTMLPPLPRRSGWASPNRVSLPRKGRRVDLRIILFETCSAFTRVTACTLAPSPIRNALSEGFSHFVTSIAAPVASGWSEPGGTSTH
jgi:hypothetical protein